MNIVKNVRSMDIAVLLDCIREIKEMNFDIEEVLDLMQLWYRDVLMFKVTKDMNLLIFKDEYKMINDWGKRLTMRGWSRSSAPSTRRGRDWRQRQPGTGDGAFVPDHEEPVVRR